MSKWVYAADAKRKIVAHIAGHRRLGPKFTACGHPVGDALKGLHDYQQNCQLCLRVPPLPISNLKPDAYREPNKYAAGPVKTSLVLPYDTAVREIMSKPLYAWLQQARGVGFSDREIRGIMLAAAETLTGGRS